LNLDQIKHAEETLEKQEKSARGIHHDLPEGHPILQAMEAAKERHEAREKLEKASGKKPKIKKTKKVAPKKKEQKQQDPKIRQAQEVFTNNIGKDIYGCVKTVEKLVSLLDVGSDVFDEYMDKSSILRLKRLSSSYLVALKSSRLEKIEVKEQDNA